MNFEVSVSPNFSSELKKLAKKYPSIKSDLSALVKSLIIDPFKVIIWEKTVIKLG